jgi:hypothetical protein
MVDIGINFEENNIDGAREFYLESEVEDIGDLSVFSGYEEVDLTGYTIEPGKTKPEPFSSFDTLTQINPVQLYLDGYVNVHLNDEQVSAKYSKLPFNIILNQSSFEESEIKTEEPANFIIKKNGEIKFAIVNGFLIELDKIENWRGNSKVFAK